MKLLLTLAALLLFTGCCFPTVTRVQPRVLRWYQTTVVGEPGHGFGVVGMRWYVVEGHWLMEDVRP